ncbi:MAG: mechanosensitive ion channel [Saprospiraceae bacterium]|nr:mechanosensitive ion channel [Saprospiraceae bacterium]
MSVSFGLPFRVMFTSLLCALVIYIVFRGYRRFILPGKLQRPQGVRTQHLFRQVEISTWSVFAIIVLYILLSHNILVATILVAIVFVAFRDFWSNFFLGITYAFSGDIRVGDHIVVGETKGRVAQFGYQAVHLVTAKGEKVLLPYRLMNVAVRIEQQGTLDVKFMSLTVEVDVQELDSVYQRIKDAMYANPWVIVTRPIDIVMDKNRVELRFYVLDQNMYERAKRRLFKELPLKEIDPEEE